MTTRNHSRLEERPPAFVYRNGKAGRTLCCEQVEVERLAQRFGTPLYIYSATAIRERVAAFERAFAKQAHTLCYSVKANSNLSVLRLLASLGCGFDVVSGGELQRVARVSKEAVAGVVFSGVGKTAGEMDAAIAAGILLFNVESEAELELLGARAARQRKTARIALRVNPDVAAETHPYISTGLRQHKFGVPMARARELYRLATTFPYLDPIGVSVHIGSQITDAAPFGETMERVVALVSQLRADGLNISFVDAGGGLGIRYREAKPGDFERSLKAYAAAITRPLRNLSRKNAGLHLLLEPGRSIVAASGALLTRALYAKENDGKQFLVTDAAMNDLVRPSLYGAHHEIVPVSPRPISARTSLRTPGVHPQSAKSGQIGDPVHPQSAKSGQIGDPVAAAGNSSGDHLYGTVSGVMDVVGPVCETGDFFARDRHLPPVAAGDLLAILDAGAYGMSLASNYNTRGRAAEVLVERGKFRLVRRRENFEDLVRAEL